MSTIAPAPPASTELDFLGSRVRVLVDGSATEGRFGLVDMLEVPAQSMPPLHVHHAHDEGFYILDGEVTLYLPDREIHCRPGDHVVAPRGIPHAYRVGDRAARWLITSNPAGFERFVVAVAALDAPDPAVLGAVAAEHGIEILGPPGTMP